MAKPLRLPIKVEDLGLTQKEMRFVGEYCSNGFDASAALKAAKLVPESITTTEARLRSLEILNKQNINTAITRFVSSELDPYRDKLNYQVLTAMQARAFYDPSVFFETDGTARPLDAIPANMRQAIDSVEIKHYGKDGLVLETIYKLADKGQSIKSLRELLDRKDGGSEDGMHINTRAKLDEIFFKAGMLAGNAISEAKDEPVREEAPITAKEHIASLRGKIQAEVVDAKEV